ncbi:DUF4159 domain-containing protein [Pedobacter aquae]|uniref:DUF4159 domain-containing protein n=1 Tax=Pedobacter aquae TaxID=2605747 RepID=A0A5C0VKL6_9SPHI|nr:DUF4159 domain-containing protein [Pedobacter aquae]QEK52687.1 DUF4159 domain-containing protein [Pedobacter aquae]
MLRNQLFKQIGYKVESRKYRVESTGCKVESTCFKVLLVFFVVFLTAFKIDDASFKIAKVKYNGGGDWYANRTALPNLIAYFNSIFSAKIAPQDAVVEVGSQELFNYPFVYLTGHGNISFTDAEAKNLRNYLIAGGFLHLDDNYGLDKFIRVQMKKVFPELAFQELPSSHPIYHQKFKFPQGLPKIHEHDNKRPQGLALIYKGRIVCFYSYESDLGNGWEDFGTYPEDTKERREQALKMGVNLLQYVLTN